MMSEEHRKNSPACLEIAPLLEKRVAEEPLHEEEQRQIDRHLHECEACREFETLTSSLPIFAQTITEEEILSAVNNAANQYFVYKRKQKMLAVALAMGAAAACCAFLFLSKPAEKVETPLAVEVECKLNEPFAPTRGVRMTFCGPNASDVTVDPQGEVLLLLTRGAVGCIVDKNRPDKGDVRVVTKYGEVRVTGTIFTVRVERDDVRVEVFRGSVEVRPASKRDAVFKVREGQGATIATEKIFALNHQTVDPLTQNLLSVASSMRPYDEQSSGETQIEGSTKGSGKALTDAGVDRIELFQQGEGEGLSSKPLTPSADSLIQSAHVCLIERDWECAASRYLQVLKDYGNRSESVSALIGLARIELHYLHKPKQALFHFSTYEKRYPSGPLIEEALLGIAESLRQLGRKEKERASLRTFIARFPNSASIEKAKSRLKEIGE
jgi:hypothetical protein